MSGYQDTKPEKAGPHYGRCLYPRLGSDFILLTQEALGRLQWVCARRSLWPRCGGGGLWEDCKKAPGTMAGVRAVIAVSVCVCSVLSLFPAVTGQALGWDEVEREAELRQKHNVSLTQSPALVFLEWGQRRQMEERFFHWQTMIRGP